MIIAVIAAPTVTSILVVWLRPQFLTDILFYERCCRFILQPLLTLITMRTIKKGGEVRYLISCATIIFFNF